jgi:signal peptidase II
MKVQWFRISLFAAALLLVGCDHVAKQVAKTELEGGPRSIAGGILELNYTENTDSGFNLLRWVSPSVRTPLLTAAQLVGGLAFLALGLRRRSALAARCALLLLAAGALGNGLDRLAHGHVVDFIHLTHWPVFNLADIYIAAGGVSLLWLSRGVNRKVPLAG